MSKVLRVGLGVSGAVVFALATAFSAAAQKAEPCIGASLELTGPLAHTGLQIRMGAEVAIDEINAAGGVLGQKLKFIT